MKRRTLLKCLGTAAAFTVPSTVQARTSKPVVRKGTVDDPVTVDEIVETTRDYHSGVTTQSETGTDQPVIPKPKLESQETILGYGYGMSGAGYPKYKISKVSPGGQSDNEVSQQKQGESTAGPQEQEKNTSSGESTDQSQDGEPLEDHIHEEIESFAEGLSSGVITQGSCTDSKLLRDTSIDGFPCPWIEGENVTWQNREDDGYIRKGSDDKGRIIIQDQLFDGGDAIGTATYFVMNPSTSYPGDDDHIVKNSYLRHAYDEKTDQEPDERVVASPDGTSGEQISSASVSAGGGALGIGLGWDNVEVDIDKNTNQRLAQWDTGFEADRGSTKTAGYTSIANYDGEIDSSDDVLRCVAEGTFARVIEQGDIFYDSETFRTDVVYTR